jgi:hypothetical protein
VKERLKPDGCILIAKCVVVKRIETHCGVLVAEDVVVERLKPRGRVLLTGGVGVERPMVRLFLRAGAWRGLRTLTGMGTRTICCSMRARTKQ